MALRVVRYSTFKQHVHRCLAWFIVQYSVLGDVLAEAPSQCLQ